MTTVLVVDDEPAIVETLAELLAWEGYDVLVASDGARALEQLRDHARPDVVILDFMMPVMDGITTLREIRATPELAGLKIILTTAAPASIPKDAPPFESLLVKPFTVKDLRAVMERVLGP